MFAILVVIYSYKVPVAENILVKIPEHHFDEPFNSSSHLERWSILSPVQVADYSNPLRSY